MQVLLRAFNTNTKAADGSRIRRAVVEEYLKSPDYEEIIRDKIAVGGITHKDRQVDDQHANIVGADDQVLISQNATHYISKIFFKDDDPICYMIINIFNPDDYSGARKDAIQNLIADLKAGVMYPCSIVIKASWSYDNDCEKIIRIKGVDFTLNPSFEGAGIDKVFSAHQMSFSRVDNEDGTSTIAIQSAFTLIPEQKVYSLQEIGHKYGLASKVFSRAKEYSGDLTEDVLTRITAEEVLPSPDEITENEIDQFSTVNAVRDRLLFTKYPRISLINRLVRSYKLYYKTYKGNITPDKMKWVQKMLCQDLSILIHGVSGKIIKGTPLTTLYGLKQFGDDVASAGTKYSKIARLCFIAEKQMGFIPKEKVKKYREVLYNLYNEFCKYCFDTEVEPEVIDSLLR